MAPRVTAIELEDLAHLLGVDRIYSLRTGVEQVVDRASVHFYQRSGHSFCARAAMTGGSTATLDDGVEGLFGFVLAHASWSGGRPVVRVERLATVDSDEGVGRALIEATVKSAYDAGVYDIVAAVPTHDLLATSALSGASFVKDAVSVYGRVLGSRGSALQGGTDAIA